MRRKQDRTDSLLLTSNLGNLIVSKGVGLIPRSASSPEIGNDNPLQYSCLENSMDGGAWPAIVHEVAKSRTWQSDWVCTHTRERKWRIASRFQVHQVSGEFRHCPFTTCKVKITSSLRGIWDFYVIVTMQASSPLGLIEGLSFLNSILRTFCSHCLFELCIICIIDTPK